MRFCPNGHIQSNTKNARKMLVKCKIFCIFGKYMLVPTKNIFTIFSYLLQIKSYSRSKKKIRGVTHLCPAFSYIYIYTKKSRFRPFIGYMVLGGCLGTLSLFLARMATVRSGPMLLYSTITKKSPNSENHGFLQSKLYKERNSSQKL